VERLVEFCFFPAVYFAQSSATLECCNLGLLVLPLFIATHSCAIRCGDLNMIPLVSYAYLVKSVFQDRINPRNLVRKFGRGRRYEVIICVP
jgi:hypothetical protein